LPLTVHWQFVRAFLRLGPPLSGWLRVQRPLALRQLALQQVLALVQWQPALELRRAAGLLVLRQQRVCDWM
jgi:hypothetical protein